MGLLRSLSLTFVAQIACQVIAVATSFVLVAFLDPADKGPFDWVVNVPFLLMSLSNLGFATAITYLGGSRQVSPQRLASLGLFLGLTIGLLTALVAYPILNAVRAEHMGNLPWWLLAASLAATPLLLVRSYLNSILLVANRIGRYNLVEVVLPTSFLLLFVVFVIVPGGHGSAVVLRGVFCRLAAIVLSLVTVLVLTSYLVRLRPRFDRRVLRRSWRHARWAYGISSATELNQRFGFILLVPILMGNVLSSGADLRFALGLLGLAIAFADMLRTLPLAVEPILFRTLAGAGDDARQITPVACRNLLLVAVLAASGIAIGAPLVILILNDTYFPCLPTLYILLPGVTTLTVAKTLHADLMGRGRLDLVFWNTLTSFLVMTGLNILCIPWLGIEGAGIAMATGYAVQACGAVFLYRRHHRVPLGQLLVPQREDVAMYREVLRKVFQRRQSVSSP